MCGIAGMVGICDEPLVRRMCERLKHRGPDDDGVYVNPTARVALGMVRLSIIDLAGGHQPMASADGRFHIVFNGEIYNFRELREELTRTGTSFRTASDTEVVLALYAREGADCVQRLRGMFAFAIWDHERQELTLVRDRLGVKPLYYTQHAGRTYFASELKALLAVPEISREIDPAALIQYLTYLYVPSPRSILQHVHKLPAATIATVREGQLTRTHYWDIAAVVQRSATHAPTDDELRTRLLDAVRSRLVSDVPLGVFLSGGIDSATIVAAMRQTGADPIRTFSIGFDSPYDTFNELPMARRVAQHYRTEHHELVVQPDVAELLPSIAYHLDEPCGDSSALLTYVIARATRQHVKVALSGIGGDELFAGYPRYLGLKAATLYERIPTSMRRGAARLAAAMPERADALIVNRVKRFLTAGAMAPDEQYLRWIQYFSEDQLRAVLTAGEQQMHSAILSAPHRRVMAEVVTPHDPLRRALAVDVSTYLSDNLLMFGDRMSMAHGLELREPLCDHELIGFIASVPSSVRLPGWRLKGWMKRAVAPWLPRELLHRRKQGFMLPLGQWLRGPLRAIVEETLAEERIIRRGWLQPKAVQHMVREHLHGHRAHTHQLWACIMLELWAQTILDT